MSTASNPPVFIYPDLALFLKSTKMQCRSSIDTRLSTSFALETVSKAIAKATSRARRRRMLEVKRGLVLERLECRNLLAANLIKDINTTPSTGSSSPASILQVGATSYFTARVDGLGTELWRTDGTAGGTSIVKDITAGDNVNGPRYLTNVNGTLFFQASDGFSGLELWKSDGTASGTVMVSDIAAGGSIQIQVN